MEGIDEAVDGELGAKEELMTAMKSPGSVIGEAPMLISMSMKSIDCKLDVTHNGLDGIVTEAKSSSWYLFFFFLGMKCRVEILVCNF